jgi:hypothetical protein
LDVISLYPDAIDAAYNRVAKLYRLTEGIAAKQSAIAENSKGQVADYYTDRANKAWSLGEYLQKLLAWLKNA